jgi:hypothetical protein
MEDAEESMVPVSFLPSELQTAPSLTDLFKAAGGWTACFLSVYALNLCLVKLFVSVQHDIPVRQYPTNAGIRLLDALNNSTDEEMMFVDTVLTLTCTWIFNREILRHRKKQETLEKIRSNAWTRIWQDAAGPVSAASPREQTTKTTNKTMFFEDPIHDLFRMLGFILWFLIFIILMPNLIADSLLEFLRTENQQDQFSYYVLWVILFMLLPLKILDHYKYIKIMIVNLVLNCIVHLEFNTLTTLHLAQKDYTPRIFCLVFVMGYVIIRAYDLMKFSHVSSFGMQMLMLFVNHENPQISWEKAAVCSICICMVLGYDCNIEYQLRNTVKTPIYIVPASRLLRQGCLYRGSDYKHDNTQAHVTWVNQSENNLKWAKNYNEDITIMAIVVFFLNLLFVYIYLYNSNKRIKQVFKKELKKQQISFTKITIDGLFVMWNSDQLWLYFIIIVWCSFELFPPRTQLIFFQMITAKKSFILQLISGEFFQNETELTCSWSNAGGAATAGTDSNSSWFGWLF